MFACPRRKTKSALASVMTVAISAFAVTGCYQNYAKTSSTDIGSSDSYLGSFTGSMLTLQPSATSVIPGGTIILSASGGTAPYTYRVYAGTGSVSNNIYTAGVVAGTSALLQVTDSANNVAYITISVVSSGAGSGTSSGGGLSLAASASAVYYGGNVTLTASGGSGVYTYSVASGNGVLSGTTYVAPSKTELDTLEVTDSAGNTATTVLAVSPSSYSSGIVSLSISYHLALAFVMPSDTVNYQPTFILAGAGSSYDFGTGVTATTGSTAAFASQPATAALIIPNYNPNDPYPFTGTLSVIGRSGTNTFGFCFLQSQSVASLKTVALAQAITSSTTPYIFTSFDGRMSSGTTAQTIWINALDGASGVGTVNAYFSSSRHDHSISDCSSYSDYEISSNSSQ